MAKTRNKNNPYLSTDRFNKYLPAVGGVISMPDDWQY
jgi:hypothetical protein